EQDRFSARQEAYAAARLQLQEEQDGDDGNQFQQRSSVKQMFKKKAWAPPPPPPMPAAAPARALPAAKSRAAPGASLDSMAMQSGALQRNISQVLERGEKMDSLGGGGGPQGGLFGSGGGGDDESDDDDDESNESSHTGSVVEETGMTTTFDLPGLKTLTPKHTSTKSPVARTTVTGVAYSHTVVAKYKPVAFLQARLRNTSRMTLFRGRAGLTLDGSFLGKATLPRCSPGAD